VRCPGCGREYAAARFTSGRTLDCACGRRVAPPPEAPLQAGGEPRFCADAMLGRLARWLRVLGYDTTFEAHVEDAALVELALREGRIVLTRDRELPRRWRVPSCLVRRSDAPLEQLREVVERSGLDPRRPLFRRCTRCNALTRAAERAEVEGRVPVRVWRREERFTVCPGCGRVYWAGSHTRRMRRTLARAMTGATLPRAR
jgi:hypothetical protein